MKLIKRNIDIIKERSISSKTTLIFIFICLLVVTVTIGWTTGSYYDYDFWQGVLVELHGVLIEFVLIVVLYGLYQKFKAHEDNEDRLNSAFQDLFKSSIFSIDMISEKNEWRTLSSKSNQIQITFGKYSLFVKSLEDLQNGHYLNELHDLQNKGVSINKTHDLTYSIAVDRFIYVYEKYRELILEKFDDRLEADLSIAYKACKNLKNKLVQEKELKISDGYFVVFKLHLVMQHLILKCTRISH